MGLATGEAELRDGDYFGTVLNPDARHSCASILHAQAVTLIVVVSAWLGHADPAFTMRTYVHSQNDALKTAAMSLQRVVSPSCQ